MKREKLKTLIKNLGTKYSEVLDINLSNGKEEEIFKWFLAAILFGAPITENSAIKTFKCFRKYGVLTPNRILETGWDGLVKILDEGSYTRYDFKTADKLLEVMQNLVEKYDGNLITIHNKASDSRDLEKRLKNLGKGIGDVTVNIFLRELRDVWEKADPNPTNLIILVAENFGIVKKEATAKDALEQLKTFWLQNKIAGKSFINFETALLRLGKDYCRKGKCNTCLVKGECLVRKVP